MKTLEQTSCRLCLIAITCDTSRIIDEHVRGALAILSLKLDLGGDKHQMCNTCYGKTFAAFEFKMKCLNSDDCIMPYVNSETNNEYDLKDIYLKHNDDKQFKNVLECQNVCRLCIQLIQDEFIHLEGIDSDLLNRFIPEINFKFTVTPVLCKTCYDSLNAYSSFVTTCLNTEEKIKNGDITMNYLKPEEMEIKLEEQIDRKPAECEIKVEKTEPISDSEETIPNNKDVKWEVDKSAQNEHNQSSNCQTKQNNPQSYNCDKCTYETTDLNHFERHLFQHVVPNTTGTFRCDQCNYKTNYKHIIVMHNLTHTNCDYEGSDSTKQDTQPNLEIKQYKCSECKYETNRKSSLTAHQLVHKDPSKIVMYECDECDFKSKRKRSLENHRLVHRDPTETQTYKCDKCDFQTRHKCNIITHRHVHANGSVPPEYKCPECNYRTKYKRYLVTHKAVHKDPSELLMHKCDKCDYETRHKYNLVLHKVKHGDSSEGPLYECETCDFKTKHKRSIVLHQVRHKDPSKVQMYKCDVCKYETKHKSYLSKHQLIHKSPCEVQMYKCGNCKYESKRKEDLKKHKLKCS